MKMSLQETRHKYYLRNKEMLKIKNQLYYYYNHDVLKKQSLEYYYNTKHNINLTDNPIIEFIDKKKLYILVKF